MAILTTADFRDDQIRKVIVKDETYISDENVTVYWHGLAKDYKIPIENLPDITEISATVKKYLVFQVSIEVCTDKVGANAAQIIDGVVVDQWELKLNSLNAQLSKFMASFLTSDDIEDPENPVVPDSNPATFAYNEYSDE